MFMNASALRAGLIAAVLPFMGGAALADSPQTVPKCFFITAWQGWSSPSPKILYLRVNRDIYRVDLSVGSGWLSDPRMHLTSRLRGSSSICTPLDLQLELTDGQSFRQGLIASAITKLSPEEAAAIPQKYRPGS
jgi:hypothetical protein